MTSKGPAREAQDADDVDVGVNDPLGVVRLNVSALWQLEVVS
jgi:hypothetical protein